MADRTLMASQTRIGLVPVRRGAAGIVLLLAGTAFATCASAQAVPPSPGQTTPQTLRPAPAPSPRPVTPDVPAPGPAEAPANAEAITVRVGSIRVDGGFPALAAETEALVAPFSGRQVTLAAVFGLARDVEAAYARRGHVLARVAVPPQELRDGSVVRLVVADGFVEGVDAANVPANVRGPARERGERIVGRHMLRLDDIERALMLAGSTPGLTLRSAIRPGQADGAAQLVLEGDYRPITLSISADNRLGSEYGGWSVAPSIALNGVMGLGEQIYATMVFNPEHLPFDNDQPRTVVGGGIILPIGNDGWQINPEFVYARTNPRLGPLSPRIRGTYQRAALNVLYPLVRTRRQQFDLTAGFEAVTETQDVVGFGTKLSKDELRAFTLGMNWTRQFRSGSAGASYKVSVGVGGLGARDQGDALRSGVPLSRQGSGPDYVKFEGGVRFAAFLAGGLSWSGNGRFQLSGSGALPSSAQFSIGSSDGISTLPTGRVPGDSGWTVREELAFSIAPGGGVTIAPYVFGATGATYLERPTAAELPSIKVHAAGVGARAWFAPASGAPSLYAGIEYGGAFFKNGRNTDRLSVEIGLRF